VVTAPPIGQPSTCLVSQSCPWVGLTHGLGWVGLGRVGLGRDFSVFGGLGWVHYKKVLKIGKDYLNAFKARLDKIWFHHAVKFDLTADLRGTGNL